MPALQPSHHALGPLRRAGFTVGFALSGFFDGILLHQVLQWHHLLSALDRGAFADLRVQVLADGLFHVLMYLIAAVGLLRLYRWRALLDEPGAGRSLAAAFWIGFGVWHVVDAVLSHWVTGIHRIRMDSPNPLLWDLAWLVLFGLVPVAIGLAMRRSRGALPGGGIAASWVALTMLGASVAGAALNLFPVRVNGAETTVVVLRPDVTAGRLLTALDGTDARIVWSDASGGVWVLSQARMADRLRLYRHGAMFVSGTVAPVGCSAWIDG